MQLFNRLAAVSGAVAAAAARQSPSEKRKRINLDLQNEVSQPASHLEYRYNDLVKAQMASVPFIAFIALVLLYREI